MPHLDAIGIVSADLGASVRFYRLLGLDVPEPTGDHIEVVLPSGLRLMFDSLELARSLAEWAAPTGHPIALAFRCASAAEVDQVHARIVAQGSMSKAAPFDAFWGQRYATVIDPDGNAIDLFADLPTS